MRDETTNVDETTSPELDTALADLAAVDTLLVALDFDGTLAPFADDPGHVGALPGSWAAVLTLQRAKGTEVVLVSGRPPPRGPDRRHVDLRPGRPEGTCSRGHPGGP